MLQDSLIQGMIAPQHLNDRDRPILLKNSAGDGIYPVSWGLLSLPCGEKSILEYLVRSPIWAEAG